MGYQTSSRTDLNFEIKTSSSQNIEANGKYLLNNWNAPQPEIEVLPSVDYLELASWDSAMTSSSFTSVKLPLNAQGTSHIKVNYKVNNPVSIFRHKNGSAADRYKWYLVYEGFHDTRIALPTSANETYDILAGYSMFSKSYTLLNTSAVSTNALDDLCSIAAQRTDSVGSTHRIGLVGNSPTQRGCIFKSVKGSALSGSADIFQSGIAIQTYPLADPIRAGDGFTADWYIGFTDGSNSEYFRKYKAHGERTGANGIVIKVERWIHPLHADK